MKSHQGRTSAERIIDDVVHSSERKILQHKFEQKKDTLEDWHHLLPRDKFFPRERLLLGFFPVVKYLTNFKIRQFISTKQQIDC
jgi:hypothetical protein